ncbi:hypothetical protein [Nocardia sp. NPDC051570]|uniref:hypothetical protein n=1 Tax=Nocardia sp. NPDC051570 TaxID=3364324 RepID=UPI0037A2ED3A
MSESTASGRIRRRAVRRPGPPVDEPPAVEIRVAVDEVAPVAPLDKVDAVAEPETVRAATESEDVARPVRLGRLGWAAAVVAVLSALVLIGSGGFYLVHQHRVDAENDRRADYLQTAKQAIINLTTISDDTAGKDLDRTLATLSGQLKNDLTQNKDAYQKVVQQIKVKSTGEVPEAAIESDDATSARVLVVAKQTVTNSGTNEPQEHNFRFRVTVTRDDKGGLTASDVEFVP